MNTTSEQPVLSLPTPWSVPVWAWFASSAAVILAVTGLAKVWAASTPTKILAMADPVTGMSFGHLMLAVGVLELVIAGICLFGKSQTLKMGLIAWLATNFVVYRFALWWMGWKKPCSCLGNLTDALHISPQVADNIMKIILAYLFIGSYGLLFWQLRKGRGGRFGVEANEPAVHRFVRRRADVPLILSLLVLTFGRFNSLGVEFTATGTALSRSYKLDKPEPVQESSFTFRVSVKDCLWRIQAECLGTTDKIPPKPPTPPSFDKRATGQFRLIDRFTVDAGTDGTNNYLLMSWDREDLRGGAIENGRMRDSRAEIEKGLVPHFDDIPVVSVLWYAYASHCYLAGVRSNSLEVPFSPTMQNPFDVDYAFEADWQCNPAPPGLPTEIYFQEAGTTTDRKLPVPFDKGLTRAVYRATSFKETGVVSVPQHPEYKVFYASLTQGAKPLPKGENLFVARQFDIRLDSIEPLPKQFNTVPSPPTGQFRVRDTRFMKATPPIPELLYDATNSWPTEHEVRQLKEFKSETENSANLLPVETRRGSRRIGLTAIGIVVLSGAGLFLFIKNITKRKDQL